MPRRLLAVIYVEHNNVVFFIWVPSSATGPVNGVDTPISSVMAADGGLAQAEAAKVLARTNTPVRIAATALNLLISLLLRGYL